MAKKLNKHANHYRLHAVASEGKESRLYWLRSNIHGIVSKEVKQEFEQLKAKQNGSII